MIAMLYSMAAVVTLCGYIPQIINIWKTKTDCRDISMSTWSIWQATSLVTLLYSHYEVADLKLCLTAGINLTCITVVIAITTYKRTRYAYINTAPSDNSALNPSICFESIKWTMNQCIKVL